MKLYQTPGGTWAGSDKDWAAAMKAEGADPKKFDGRKIVEVPTDKASLMEFLTFHGVNVINPQAATPAPEVVPAGAIPQPPAPPSGGTASSTTVSDLDGAFEAAPLRQQLRLAVGAIDRADALLSSPIYSTPAAA